MKEKKTKLLSELCEVITKGTTPTTMGYEFQDEGINFLKIESFDIIGTFMPDKVGYISEECHQKFKRSQLKVNDILFSIAGAIGRVAIVTQEMLPANTNQALAIIRINNANMYIPYVKLVLTSKFITDQFNRQKQGVAQLNLSLKNIGDLLIPIIPYNEQVHLVELFEKVKRILMKRNIQLELLDNLIKSRFVEMFGDIVSNSKDWTIDSLSNHLNVVGGYAFKSKEFAEEGIPVLKIGNINAGYFRPTNLAFWVKDAKLKRYEIVEGDLVMSLTGTVGKDDYGNVCVMGNDYPLYYLNQRNAKLDLLDTIDKHYIMNALKVPEIKKRLTGISRGVRQANISNRDILNLELPIPTIHVQIQYAEFVQHVDKLKVVVQKSLGETQELFDSLMQKYFE